MVSRALPLPEATEGKADGELFRRPSELPPGSTTTPVLPRTEGMPQGLVAPGGRGCRGAGFDPGKGCEGEKAKAGAREEEEGRTHWAGQLPKRGRPQHLAQVAEEKPQRKNSAQHHFGEPLREGGVKTHGEGDVGDPLGEPEGKVGEHAPGEGEPKVAQGVEQKADPGRQEGPGKLTAGEQDRSQEVAGPQRREQQAIVPAAPGEDRQGRVHHAAPKGQEEDREGRVPGRPKAKKGPPAAPPGGRLGGPGG